MAELPVLLNSISIRSTCWRFRFLVALVLCHAGLQVDVAVADNRSFDGTGNNLTHDLWGATGSTFDRRGPVSYVDQISQPASEGLPDARTVSVELFQQQEPHLSDRGLSGYVYAFGQLLSHDMQHSSSGQEPISFVTPPNDDFFVPGQVITLGRSIFDVRTGLSPGNPRQQLNFSTAWLDASPVYGTDVVFANQLRGDVGAKLLTSKEINGNDENLLPKNVLGENPEADFVAGDSRVNDNVILTSLQTLFMREHNRLVDVFATEHPTWTNDELYHRARKTVGAQFQVITYNEFLPALLGPHAPSPHGAYDAEVNPQILNEFPTVFLRIGHSMLTNQFLRIENDGQPAPEGPIDLFEAFQNPAALATSRDLELYLKGLTFETQEETDLELATGMRIAFLGAIDILRARDHGLPDYNTLRAAYGLPKLVTFAEITSDPEIQQTLEELYGDVDSIDPFVGALIERHLPGASVGPLVAAGYVAQFERARDGDRFWYENDTDLSAAEITALSQTTLADIIRRNTGVRNIPDNVFFSVPEPTTLTLLLACFGFCCLRFRS